MLIYSKKKNKKEKKERKWKQKEAAKSGKQAKLETEPGSIEKKGSIQDA